MMGNSGVSLFVILAVSVNCLCCLMVVSAWEMGMSVEKVMTLLAEIQERAGGGVGRPGSGRPGSGAGLDQLRRPGRGRPEM